MDPSLSALHDLLLRSQHEARAGKPNSEGQSSASSLFLDMQTQRTLGALPSTSCFGSKGLSAEAQCAGTRPVDRGFRVFGWNLGGCSADTLCDLVKTATREAVFDSDLFLLQELPRSRTGWATTTTKEGYRLVGHQGSSQWRGTGLLYSPLAWSVIRRVAKGKGTWFLLKSLRSSVQFWVATFHFTPGLTVQKHEQEVLEFLKGRPSDGRPVLLQGDSNAHLGWVAGSGAVEALGLEGKSIMMLDQFSAAGIRLCPPPSRQFPTPTSRPRREGCEGHQIDFGATKGVPLYIHEDSYMLQGTDHELLELRFWLRLAAQCTRPRPSKCFRDPRAVKEAFRRAKTSRSPAAWKTALRLRREARRSWESARIRRATEGDWQAFRDETRVQATGWDLVYADAQACDPHQSVHQHLTEVYSGDDLPPLPPFVGPVQAFSIEELTKAVSQIRKGKSVGVDLTSRELLDGILQTTGGPEHLLEFMNRTLCTQTVPRDWNRPLVIMLAKTDSPTAPSDLRPIAVGSSAAKLFSRLLVNRIAPKLAPRTHSQCASSGRQTCDVVCSLWKLCELEREWKAGLGVVKVDVRKAFDSVNRAALLAALRARLGDTAEYRCFHALLVDVEAVLQTCWGSSLLAMKSGIKQGSIESPILFSFLMEVALEQARVKSSWDQGSHLFHDMLEEDLLYMDDGYLWGPDCRTLGVRLGQLAEVLQGFGLTLNIAKCVLYCSPYCPGPHKLRLHRVTLEASDHLPVMGLKMRVGMSMSELIQPLLSRARSKFWGLKHLFRSKTQAKGRVQLMHRVISNTALWCIAALPPDRPALALVNSFQALLLTWLLRLGKRADEDWPAFRKRAVRSARYSLHVAGCPRWSTCWLTRWWTFAGHRVRASQQQFPPISTILEMFRDRQWWQKAKDAGLSHPERFFARLHSLDKAMDTVCGGPWRVYALDRAAWQAKLSTWIQQRDLPWATERVIPMCDRHPGFGAFYMYFLLPALGTILPFFAQLPGVLAPIPDDYGNWPPIWFTEATLRGRDLAARGLRMSDALAMLARTASHRNFATYTNFASRAAVAIGNTLELPVSNLAPEEIHLDLRVWVTFVEAHILEEFLEHEYPFQQGLYEGLRNVNPNLASLPAPPQETMLRAQRREEFNQLRRDPPFIRHLRASTGPAFRSHSLMRLEWVGRCVGDFHDLYHAGYNLHGVFEEMVAFIRARDNGSYRSLALPYYREVLSQLGTFLGSPDSSRPPQASEWVADRESELWYLYNYHGLKARDVDVDDISVGNASSSNRSCAEEAADDVSSLMDRKGVNKRWLKNAPTRRRRAPSRPRTPHASTTPRSLNRPSAPTTTERVNLSAMAKHKCRGTPMPATTRPTPKARPAARAPLPRSEKPTHRSPPQASREQGASRDMPASSSEAAGAGGTGPDGPLTVEEALDTWLLLLGVRDIDEPIGTDVLPERVTTAIQNLPPAAGGMQQMAAPCAAPQQNLPPAAGGPQQAAAPCAVPQQNLPPQQVTAPSAVPQQNLPASGPQQVAAPCAVPQQNLLLASVPQQQVMTAPGAVPQQNLPAGAQQVAAASAVPWQQNLPASGPPQQTAAPSAVPPQQNLPASGPPQQQVPAPSAVPPQNLPASGPPQQVAAPSADPPQNFPASGPQQQVAAPSADPPQNFPASGPQQQVTAPCAVPQNLPPARTLLQQPGTPSILEMVQELETQMDQEEPISVNDTPEPPPRLNRSAVSTLASAASFDDTSKDLVAPDTSAALLVKAPSPSPTPVTAKAKSAARTKPKAAAVKDEYALPELTLQEKAMYGNFWSRYRSSSSLSLTSDADSVDSDISQPVPKGPPAVPQPMPLPTVPLQQQTTAAAAGPTSDAMTTMLATVLSTAVSHGVDAAGLAAIQQTMASIVAAAKAPDAAAGVEAVDKTKIIDSQPALPPSPFSTPLPASTAASPSTPLPPASTASPSTPLTAVTKAPPTAGPAPSTPLPPQTAVTKAPPTGPVVNSSTHRTEYRSFQRFCENSPGAVELKKVWVQGGPQRLAMFQKFVLTGCGNPAALECALQFRRQSEEESKDEGEYYCWRDILAFHEGNEQKALSFIARRRAEPKGTSCDRNDPDMETFLYYGRQRRTLTVRTIDEIAISMGVCPNFATSVAAQLDSMNGALPVADGATSSVNPPVPAPGKAAPKGKGSAPAPPGTTTEDPQPPPKKAKVPKPEGSDMELICSGENVGLFVKSWVAAANTAQGQAVKTCAELEVLESQEALMGKIKDCAEGIGACRKKLQLMGTEPVAADVQSALLEATVFVEGFKKHLRVANEHSVFTWAGEPAPDFFKKWRLRPSQKQGMQMYQVGCEFGRIRAGTVDWLDWWQKAKSEPWGNHPVQSWPEEARQKAVAVSIHGDEGTGKRSKSILILSLSPLAIHRGDSMLQKFPFCVPWPVVRSDRFVYDNGQNITLQALQRYYADSFRICGDPASEGQHGWTMHPVISKGDWKHKREWLEQCRSYGNLASNAPREQNAGRICPRCLCDGSTPGKHWADMREGFDNQADLDEASNDSS
ncbi:RTase [Symbiodinium sp. CCMP2592]|nr:RTase [Symbiodinium sp. CCMP2592]